MRSLLLLVLSVACSAQTVVTLRKADGSTWTGALKDHPRVWISDEIQTRISDPDGHGPKVAPMLGGANPNYQDERWRALHSHVALNSGNGVYKTLPTALLVTALGWLADNNASFSGTNHNACDATKDANQDLDCYKWWAVDRLKNFDKYFTSNGVCFDTDGMCAYDQITAGSVAYYGDNLVHVAQAYSILRQFLTPAERTAVSRRIINGIQPPLPGQARCENRIPFALPGTFTYTSPSTANSCTLPFGTLQTPMTGTYTPAAGEKLPADMAGKTIAYHVAWGRTDFTNQSSVVLQTPGYTAGFHTCWDTAGVAITGTKAAYSSNSTTVTMPNSTPLSGTCIANYGNTSRPGILGVVQSVDPNTNTFTFASCPTFRDSINKLYIAADPNPNSCGLAFNNTHHGDSTVYPAYKEYWQAQTKLAQAVKPADTVIRVTGDGTWAKFPNIPGFLIQIGSDRYTGEMMLVTAIDKTTNTMTVVRGFQESGIRAHPIPASANAWPVQYMYNIAFQGGSAAWNNRNMTKAAGNLALALAFYEDDPEAAALLSTAVDYYWSDFFEVTKNYYTHLNNALIGYGISREMHYIGAMTAMLLSSSNGNLDYRYPKMKDNFGSFFPYGHFPWDVKHMLITGNTPDNCKSFAGSNEGQCYEPMIMLQHFYPGSVEAQYAWQFATLGGRIFPYEQMRLATGLRIVLARWLFETGTETTRDWTQDLPPYLISTQPAAGNTQGLGFLISKTDWSPSACISYMWTPVGWGEKWNEFVPVGHYGIGCDGDMFIGMAAGNPMAWIDTYNNGNYERSADRQATVIPGIKTFQKGDAYNQSQGKNSDTDPWFTSKIDLRYTSSKVVYARADVKDWVWNAAGKTSTAFSRNFRHFLHFKPSSGKQHWIILDDVALTSPSQLRSQIPYNNNGKSITGYPQQGWTTLDGSGTKVSSVSYRPTQKMVTTLVRGGSFYTSDLNVIQQTAQSRFIIGPTCALDHPCRVRMTATGAVATFTTPGTVIYTPGDRTNEFIAWFDPADQQLHAAPVINAVATGSISCQGGVICEAPVATWPSGVVRLHLYRQYPNTTCGASSALSSNGYESYHCGTNGGASNSVDEDNQVIISDKDSDIVKRLFMSSGYSSSGDQYLVVHEVLPQTDTEDPVSEVTIIHPNFIGVQIGGTTPQVAIFGRGTTTSTFGETSFTTTHSGTGQYLVAGLTAGLYNVNRNGLPIQTNISVTDAGGALYFESASGNFSITQVGTLPSLVISTSALPDGTATISYSQILTATGGAPPYLWSLQSGTLPAGITLSSAGSIAGAPTTAGTSAFVVRVTDSLANQASRNLSISVAAVNKVRMTTTGLDDAAVGVAYQSTLTADGGTMPYTWTITAGSLPAGLTWTAAGTIQGTPTVAGTYPVTVRVTDATGDSTEQSFIVNVTSEYPLSLLSEDLPNGFVGQNYTFTLSASGGTQPYTWSIAGNLPAGLTLDSQAGVINGVPTGVEDSSILVVVTDANDMRAQADMTISTVQYVNPGNIDVAPLSQKAVVKYGFAGLKAETICTLDARSLNAAGPIVFSTTDQGGPSRRIAALTNLDPSAIHSLELRCEEAGSRKEFQTRGSAVKTSLAAVTAPLSVQMSAPIALPVTQLELDYGADPAAMTSVTTVQCTGKCIASIDAERDSILYLQPKWLDSQGRILATGSIKVVAVP